MPQKTKRGLTIWVFCIMKVLIGLFPRTFGVLFSSYRKCWGGAQSVLGETLPLSGALGKGGEDSLTAGLRPSLGRQILPPKESSVITTCVRKGPSMSGFRQGPMFRDPCSLEQSFFSSLSLLVGFDSNSSSPACPLISPPSVGPGEYIGMLLHPIRDKVLRPLALGYPCGGQVCSGH